MCRHTHTQNCTEKVYAVAYWHRKKLEIQKQAFQIFDFVVNLSCNSPFFTRSVLLSLISR